jgi:hypothetical protein
MRVSGRRVEEREVVWRFLSQELGEALLDAERTFLQIVDRHPSSLREREQALEAYLEAWWRLIRAHKAMADFLRT